MACVGCPGAEADRLQERLSSEEMALNNAAVCDSDAVESASDAQSAECSDSANCTTMPAATSTSSTLVISTVTAEGPSESSNMGNGLCAGDSSAVETAELSCEVEPHCCVSDSACEGIISASDRQPVCAAHSCSVDSSMGACSEPFTATAQKTEGGSASMQSQYSSSLVEVKCSDAVEKCWHNSNIPGLSQKCSTQSSIRSFFASLSKKQPHETDVSSGKSNTKTAASHSPQNWATLLSCSQQTDAKNAVTSENPSFIDKTRKCPFYKWIPGKVSYSSC